jgi:hypothetical protein
MNKSSLFPQEICMQEQIERQAGPLTAQKSNFFRFYQTESVLINKTLISDNFVEKFAEYPSWEVASFYPGDIKSPTQIRGSWVNAHFDTSSLGLQIRSLILRSKEVITLKSIACELKLSFRLVGDSDIWIVTRALDIKDSDAVICKIKKEQFTQRVFLVFGANIGSSNEFKFFKKQEFPGQFIFNNEKLQDYVDIKIKFIDNGDDKVIVSTNVNKKKSLNMTCDKYIPTFKNTYIMVAGSGDSVLLKSFKAKYIARVHPKINASRQECCKII